MEVEETWLLRDCGPACVCVVCGVTFQTLDLIYTIHNDPNQQIQLLRWVG
jgi:hypothetical protein